MSSWLRSITRACLGAVLASALLIVAQPGTASATLQLLKPDPSIAATFVGNGGYSADGLGQDGGGGTVQAEVPSGSTVVKAYLYGTYFSDTNPILADRTIDFDGTSVVLTTLPNSEPGNNELSTARADITAQVAAKVGSGGGITDFVVNTDPATLDGVGLIVIFSNPALPKRTIAVLDGGSKQTGDTATLNFAKPLDTSVAGFSAIMSLGSGYSYQAGIPGHACGGDQFSTVDVNGSRLTSCAGNFDDGLSHDGALITVGGVGDSTDNPADPNAQSSGTDDELYNLVPFLHTGDMAMTIATTNPSINDNLFVSVIQITADATVTTEICNNTLDDDGDGLIDLADPDCASHITTTLSGGGQAGTSISVPPATAVHDSAALTGNSVATASGTVAYQVFSDSSCATTPTSAGTKTVTNGIVPDSDPLTLAVGTWYWKAGYSGDSTHTAASSCNEVVTVTAGPSAPTASAQSVSTNENAPIGITLTGSDPNGDPLSYAVVGTPAHGTLSGTAPNLTYTPAAGYSGPDSFTFKVNDGKVDSNTATVSITVTPVNANCPPTANSQSVSTNQNTPIGITLTGSDPNGDSLSYAVVGTPAHGTLSGTAPNLTYTPAAGYSGPDSFTFKVNDGKVDSNIATVSITVIPVPPNHPPTADPQCVSTPINTAVPIVLTGSDPDGNPLAYSIATGPAHGTLSGSGPSLTYTPASGYSGPDSFTFSVSDGHVSSTAQVSITVTKASSALHCESKGKHGHGRCKWWHVGKHHAQLTVRNHGRGWVTVTVWVNGHRLRLGNLKNGPIKKFNISRYMKGNGRDVVIISAVGSTGASAVSFGI